MAEREGFEPPIPFQVWPLSRRLVSTTHAPLRAVKVRGSHYFSRSFPRGAAGLCQAGLNAAISKERLDQLRALFRQNPRRNFHAVVEPGMIDDFHD